MHQNGLCFSATYHSRQMCNISYVRGYIKQGLGYFKLILVNVYSIGYHFFLKHSF